MSLVKERLAALIEFAEQASYLKTSLVTDLTKHNSFYVFEEDISEMDGIELPRDMNEAWIKISRLEKTKPNEPSNAKLLQWLDNSFNPKVPPSLKKSIINENGEVALFTEFSHRFKVEESFKKYLECEWHPWAYKETRRLKTIELYSNLFEVKRKIDIGYSDTPLEIVLGIGIAYWKREGLDICYPLLTQAVDIVLNTDMTLEIKLGYSPLKLETDIYLSNNNSGAGELEVYFKDSVESNLSPFESTTYEHCLKKAATLLDPQGGFIPRDKKSTLKINNNLVIKDNWVLFIRPKSKNQYIKDLNSFKSILNDDAVDVDGALEEFFTSPRDKVSNKSILETNFIGLSSGFLDYDSPKTLNKLYFPLHYNDEQVKIVEKLEQYNGVVVQGPPGTGKTHTIANIVAHYMSNGKKVLVTSMRETALSVLRDKLPDELKLLAISILANERDGMKQLDDSISNMSYKLQSIDQDKLTTEIVELEAYINEIHASIALTDRQISAWAKNNIDAFTIDGKIIYPEQAARELHESNGTYEWLLDNITIDDKYKLEVTDDDINTLRLIRIELGKDIELLGYQLPHSSDLPALDELLSIHNNLIDSRDIKENLKLINFNFDNKLDGLFSSELISNTIKAINKIDNDELSDNAELISEIRKVITQQSIKILFDDIELSLVNLDGFLLNPVVLPDSFIYDEELIIGIKNLSIGKRAFGALGDLFKAKFIKIINQIKIVNTSPKNLDDWSYVYNFIQSSLAIKENIIKWNSVFQFSDIIPKLDIKNLSSSVKTLKQIVNIYRLQCDLQENKQLIANNINLLIGENYDYEYILKKFGNKKKLLNFLNDNLRYTHLLHSSNLKNQYLSRITNFKDSISLKIKFLINDLGDCGLKISDIRTSWIEIITHLDRLHALRSKFDEAKYICEKIEKCGGKDWSRKLLSVPSTTNFDMLLPLNWKQCWNLRRVHNHFYQVSDFVSFKKLYSKRKQLEVTLLENYKTIIIKKTWSELNKNTTSDVKSSLQSFQTAISKIGKGRGKRSVRYRQDAKNATSVISKAIPCWIVPHYRIPESFAAEFGYFDLVIIDEASQSDLSALPAILRAKKLLVVGDDKQVSPSGLGLKEENIITLMNKSLSNQIDAYKSAMSPDRSIYALCKIVFANSQIMLREHFRCVPAIIEYSKREFYNHNLKPLRTPKQSEMLLPPLVDVLIEDGFRRKSINEPEAVYIAKEVRKICNDINMSHRTIGVISLLGNEQAKRIEELLNEEINFEQKLRHKIKCGDALTFQGEERDIMFLSMVVTPKDCKANSGDVFTQRFNVAASRAKDRMYLVRSVNIEDLSPIDTLRINLIKHFHNPFGDNESNTKNIRDLCESKFEKDVYDFLCDRGFKVIPQFRVGNYRIDLVVEGHNDNKLAIECDGDNYHPHSKWADDIKRQRVLERAGWKFWRCFASTYYLNIKETQNDLLKTLEDFDICALKNTISDDIKNKDTCFVKSRFIESHLDDFVKK